LAWESAINQISVLRVVEGLQTFEGYSPILFCNAAYVDDQANQTDAVVFYLKDINGYSGVWNYNTLYNPNGQFPDLRRGTSIYFRVQRDNFLVEYKMCDLPFEVQYLDNVTFSGLPFDPQEGDTFKQALSMVDGLCNRFTAISGQYFVLPPPDPHIPASASDSMSATISISGLLFDTVMSESAVDYVALTPSVSGELFDATVFESTSDQISAEPSVTGILLKVVIPESTSDALGQTPEISGTLLTTVVGAPNQTDILPQQVEIFGELVTV
jgi:hypothetical protein